MRQSIEHQNTCQTVPFSVLASFGTALRGISRTDLYIYQGVIGDLPCIGDTKIFAGVPSDPSGVERIGAFVACGNMLPRARETVLGVEAGDRHGRVGRWDPRTGTGTVEAVKGQYTDAEGWRRCSSRSSAQ